ncbi:hypothetical protein Q760_06345 [Cellulomonas cellasea DSM 20118]|uniref:Uncharacterized protein n=1 Tax=Cellulomonas cellasea DSM 20118 TaxID=1408250 RepID=A0A0A0B1P3_9CELL|nr:hypothetical protein Q760_06345 [Cellulomonas cellasea DSM 20118]
MFEGMGVDGQALIRYGLAEQFAGPVLGTVAVALMLEARGNASPARLALEVDGWRAALGVTERSRPAVAERGSGFDSRQYPHVAASLRAAPTMLHSWIATAPFEELVSLVPPRPEEMAAVVGQAEQASALFATYQWLVQRNTEKDLSGWSTEALHKEYQYVAHGEAAAMPAALLDARLHEVDTIAREVADRAVRHTARPGDDEDWYRLLTGVHRQARRYLGDGRHAEAAALFEFLLTRRPTDARALNNLGFCLLPVDPARADRYFLQADEQSFSVRSLLLYNRMCCGDGSADMAHLLFATERHWASGLEGGPQPAVIWRRDASGSWEVCDTLDVRVDLAKVAAEYCTKLSRHDRVRVWLGRAEALIGPTTEDSGDT